MRRRLRLCLALAPLLLALLPCSCLAWGPDGHRIINRLAAENLPPNLPAFLRSKAAIDEIEYLGPEPDRWRGHAEPELNAAQAPEHFIDLELADEAGPLPRRRYDFLAALYAAALAHPVEAGALRPEKVGLLPYAATENFERLQAGMREYRDLAARGKDTKPAEAAILYYAGLLGHYVGDGAQPLHTTVNYNGWVQKENPRGYVTTPGIHEQFESTFVKKNIRAKDVAPFMAPVHVLDDPKNPLADCLGYLRQSHALVEETYQLEAAPGFTGSGTAASHRFTGQRLAAAASELRDMIVTAWQQSAFGAPS